MWCGVVSCHQGIGKMMMLGAATDKSVEIDFVTLLSCRTFKYAVFGGVKVQSDLPLVIHKCINKVLTLLTTKITSTHPLNFCYKKRKKIILLTTLCCLSAFSSLQEIQNLDRLLTHQCPLEDINRAFELLKEPQCVKVLIIL